MEDEPGRWLTLVGIGEDGIDGLSPAARAAVEAAPVVFGGRRHLALAGAALRGEGVPWLSPLEASLPALLARRGQATCVLASGDPFHYGIGATLVRHVPAGEIACLPHSSAFSLAAARLGWPLQDVACLSLHGRALERIVPVLQPGRRVLALSWDGSTPAQLASLLDGRGFGASVMHVCEAMGGPAERIGTHEARRFDQRSVEDLNTIGIEVRAERRARVRPLTPGLPDDWFEHDGQITKAPIRAVTLAALAPRPGELLWDVGSGSGSVSIEWLLQDASLCAVAIERDGERAARIRRNATTWGVADRIDLRLGSAPEGLETGERPDAIFVGGGATAPGLIDVCMARLKPGGRLVLNGVTLETQALLAQHHARLGGDLLTLAIATAEPVGRFHGLRPAMPVMQWRWVKA